MKTRLAVVILNWNGKKYLEKFLPVLLQYCPEYAEVIVADNASSDDSVSFLQENYPRLRIIRNNFNGGFSKGYNDALKLVDSEYYCLLNSDIEVTANWIDPIIMQMDADPMIAAVQPKLRSYVNRDFFEYAGASGGFLDKFGYPFCRGRLFESVEKDNGQYDDPIEVFWATGAALFVKSEIYHRVGGLDEDFFAHMEEIDFCWRIKNKGYKVMINPSSVVYHIGGGTLPKNNELKTYLNFRNNLFVLLKNLPSNRLFVTFFVRFFLDKVAAMLFLAQGHGKDFLAVYKALFAFLKNFKRMKRKRGGGAKEAFADTCKHSIVFVHYIGRKRFFNGKKFI